MLKKYYLISLIVVVVFAMVAASAFLYSRPQQKPAVPLITPAPTTVLSPTPADITPSGSSAVQNPAPVNEVKIFMMVIGDNGTLGDKVGCGDSIVGVTRKVTPTTTPLTAALNELLGLKVRELGQSGLYNSLYQSNLKLDSATVDAHGLATVKISGQVQLGGTCDSPRFKEQILRTVTQFPTVKNTLITINGDPLDQVVSSK